jgi:hypothetical protein
VEEARGVVDREQSIAEERVDERGAGGLRGWWSVECLHCAIHGAHLRV